MASYKSRFQHRAVIDITSLIDLIFLLVAFFMVTYNIGAESTITVHLPKAQQTGVYKKGTAIVSVNVKNEIFINDKKIVKNKLLAAFSLLKQKHGSPVVIIRGDKRADYQSIVNIIDALNQAGISRFTISAIK